MTKNLILLIALMYGIASASAQNKDALSGRWMTASGDAQIQIYAMNGKFSGRIIWLKNPNDNTGKPQADTKNPDATLAKRPLIGLEMLKGFTYKSHGVWEGGTIYDPKTGNTYSCKISMGSADKINVRGFVGISLLGRTETWTRLK